VNLGDAVDGVRADDAEVGHVDRLLAALLHQGHAAHAVAVAREPGGHVLVGGGGGVLVRVTQQGKLNLWVPNVCVFC